MTTEPPPNPFDNREYVFSMKHGQMSMLIPAPGGRLPDDEDEVIELITFLLLVIRQLQRGIGIPTEGTMESVPISPEVTARVRSILKERGFSAYSSGVPAEERP